VIKKIEKINSVKGELTLPGDKSISHRAVMFSAMADGKSTVHNYLNSEDVNSTIDCFRKLGTIIMKVIVEFTFFYRQFLRNISC